MSKSTKSNRKKQAGSGQASNRPKHRAPSDSLIDLNSSADETPPVTAPNKRAKADNQTVMDLDQVVAEGSTSTSPPPPVQNIVSPTVESAVQQESAASPIIQQTPENPPVDPVPPTEDPITESVNQSPPIEPNQEANNEDMIVDRPLVDQPNFSLNIGKIRYTAWSSVESFSPLKLPISQLKNKITGLIHDLPGFITVKQGRSRSEEHTSELQSHSDLVCRLLLEKKNKKK